jgi:hypothetical protein
MISHPNPSAAASLLISSHLYFSRPSPLQVALLLLTGSKGVKDAILSHSQHIYEGRNPFEQSINSTPCYHKRAMVRQYLQFLHRYSLRVQTLGTDALCAVTTSGGGGGEETVPEAIPGLVETHAKTNVNTPCSSSLDVDVFQYAELSDIPLAVLASLRRLTVPNSLNTTASCRRISTLCVNVTELNLIHAVQLGPRSLRDLVSAMKDRLRTLLLPQSPRESGAPGDNDTHYLLTAEGFSRHSLIIAEGRKQHTVLAYLR